MHATKAVFRLALLAVYLGIAAPGAMAAEPYGQFLHISDIHYDPYATGPAFSHYGKDTDEALLNSALSAIGRYSGQADFVVVTGDFLVHDFEATTARKFNVAENSDKVREEAVRTTLYVADRLGQTLAGKPVILALGNNDSGCGDYHIDPNGPYLAQTKDTVRRLAGTDLVAADFDKTYAAGGYFAMRHPTNARVRILVLNDVLWSAKYQDDCGTGGLAAAEVMLDWLAKRLDEASKTADKIWLVHHIPIGVDSYATAHSKVANCSDKTVSFLSEPFATRYPGLLAEYGAFIQTSLVGHVHFDSYRLVLSDKGEAWGVEKIAPAISPIFGQNPGFHLFTYDKQSAEPTDFSTISLANLEQASATAPADWRLEYRFTEAYHLNRYSASAVAGIWRSLAQPGPIRDTFSRLYNVGHGVLAGPDFPAYSCAIADINVQSFAECYCGN